MGEYAKKALKTFLRWEKNPPTKRDQKDQPTYFLEESLEEDHPKEHEPKDPPAIKP